MAERRMFAKTIVESDAFLEMPLSSQALYFHCGMIADDDGFVGGPRRLLRNVGASEDDLRILIAKRFVIPFDSGVLVVKHWRMNNYIQKDRYKPTPYQDEIRMLGVKENNAYTLTGHQAVLEEPAARSNSNENAECIQTVSNMDTTCIHRLGKDRDRVRLGQDSISEGMNNTEAACAGAYARVSAREAEEAEARLRAREAEQRANLTPPTEQALRDMESARERLRHPERM